MDAFPVLFDRFLQSLASIEGLHEDDLDFLIADARAKLSNVLKAAEDLASHRTEEERAAAIREDASRRAKAAQQAAAARSRRPPVSSKALDRLEAVIAEKLFEHTAEPRELFLHFDVASDGTLSAAEFRRAINEVGILLSEEEVEALLLRYDTDNNGTVDYVEFLAAIEAPDRWATSASTAYAGLDRSHIPTDPSLLRVPQSEALRLGSLRDRIVRRIAEHCTSAREFYLSINHKASPGGAVSLTSIRAGLRRLGLKVSLDDLELLTGPFAQTYPRQALALQELQQFLDSRGKVPEAGSSSGRGGGGGGGGGAVDTSAAAADDHHAHSALEDLLHQFHGQEESLRGVLQRYDMDHDGYLSVDEFRRALAVKGYRISKDSCRAIMRQFPASRGDKLYFPDLISRFTSKSGTSSRPGMTSAVAAAAAASASRRHSMGGPGGGRAAQSGGGAGAAPPLPAVSAGLVRRVADAVYMDPNSVHTLYKRMASSHEGISPVDLIHGMKRCGLHLTHPEAQSLVLSFDRDGDSRLSHAEFVKLLAASS